MRWFLSASIDDDGQIEGRGRFHLFDKVQVLVCEWTTREICVEVAVIGSCALPTSNGWRASTSVVVARATVILTVLLAFDEAPRSPGKTQE